MKLLVIQAAAFVALIFIVLVASGKLQISLSCRKCGYEPSGFRAAAEHMLECRGKR